MIVRSPAHPNERAHHPIGTTMTPCSPPARGTTGTRPGARTRVPATETTVSTTPARPGWSKASQQSAPWRRPPGSDCYYCGVPDCTDCGDTDIPVVRILGLEDEAARRDHD